VGGCGCAGAVRAVPRAPEDTRCARAFSGATRRAPGARGSPCRAAPRRRSLLLRSPQRHVRRRSLLSSPSRHSRRASPLSPLPCRPVEGAPLGAAFPGPPSKAIAVHADFPAPDEDRGAYRLPGPMRRLAFAVRVTFPGPPRRRSQSSSPPAPSWRPAAATPWRRCANGTSPTRWTRASRHRGDGRTRLTPPGPTPPGLTPPGPAPSAPAGGFPVPALSPPPPTVPGSPPSPPGPSGPG
jgi:hypothetical protein